jgi:hypothetical protein
VIPHRVFKREFTTIGGGYVMNARERRASVDGEPTEPIATHEIAEDESVTEAVVTTVSSATNAGKTDLRPLYTAIDPDALDAIFGSRRGGTPRAGDGTIAFEYEGHDVRVGSDGRVVVY